MFDIGFTELMIIGVIGLVVIGPERLPRVARTVGHLLGRLQRYVSDVKSDVQREMQLEDLKDLQREVTDSAREIENSIRREAGALKEDLDRTADSVHSAIESAAVKDGSAPAKAPARDGDAPKDDADEAQLALQLARDRADGDKGNKA